MSRYHVKRRDANQLAIVSELREIGATVIDLSQVGGGCPDLLVGYRNKTYLLEIKTAAEKLSSKQRTWWVKWNGRPPVCVKTPTEALIAIGIDIEEMTGL